MGRIVGKIVENKPEKVKDEVVISEAPKAAKNGRKSAKKGQ